MAIAAFVPGNLFWTIAVVAVGVFFTIVSAPVSYPAMVFWMSIAFVPLFATEGRYLDLITDKSVAALIGGCVAAVVALTIVPIRPSREIRAAVLTYLDASARYANHAGEETNQMTRCTRSWALAAATVFALAAVPGTIVTIHAPGIANADVCVSGGRRISVSGCANIADAVAPYVPPPAYYAHAVRPTTAPNVSGCVSYNGRWINAAGCN